MDLLKNFNKVPVMVKDKGRLFYKNSPGDSRKFSYLKVIPITNEIKNDFEAFEKELLKQKLTIIGRLDKNNDYTEEECILAVIAPHLILNDS